MEPEAGREPGGTEDEDALQVLVPRWVDGLATVEEMNVAFLGSTLFLQAGERPGFMALGEPAAGLVPVWTSEREMARSLGVEAAWFSTTGADLLSLLPPGYDVLLDADGDAPVRLRPSALRKEPGVAVAWETNGHAPRS